MRAMRQPTRFTLEKATDLGQLMAMTEPALTPHLADAHEYPGYVQFIQAHRYRMEQEPAYSPWDARLTAMIETEGKMLGFVLTDRDEYDELVTSIATPIRCAFWYGWETVHALKKKYDQHMKTARTEERQVQVIQVSQTPEAPKIARKPIIQEDDAFWDKLADNMLASLHSAGGPDAADPASGPTTR